MDNKRNDFKFLKLKSSEYAELVAADLFKNELGKKIEILFPLKRNFKDSDFFLYVNESKPPKIISVQVKNAKFFTNNAHNDSDKRNQMGNAVFQFRTNDTAELYCLLFYVHYPNKNGRGIFKPKMLVMDKKEVEENFKECKNKSGGYRFSLAVKKENADEIFIEKFDKALGRYLIGDRKKEQKFIKKIKEAI